MRAILVGKRQDRFPGGGKKDYSVEFGEGKGATGKKRRFGEKRNYSKGGKSAGSY